MAGITFAEAVTDKPVSDWGRDGGAAIADADGFGPDSHGDPDQPIAPTPTPTAPSASPSAAAPP